MNLIEIIITSVGLSLDVFAVVTCYGAVLLRLEKMRLLKMSLIYCAIQVSAVIIGHMITFIPYLSVAAESMRGIWELISVAIFVGLGLYLVYKAWKREIIFEHVTEIHYKNVFIAAIFTGIDALLAGMAFGFMKTNPTAVIISMAIVTVVVVILGLICGYRLGYEQKTKAYSVGGALLFISAADIIIRYMAM